MRFGIRLRLPGLTLGPIRIGLFHGRRHKVRLPKLRRRKVIVRQVQREPKKVVVQKIILGVSVEDAMLVKGGKFLAETNRPGFQQFYAHGHRTDAIGRPFEGYGCPRCSWFVQDPNARALESFRAHRKAVENA